MPGVSRTDNAGGDLWLIQNPAGGDRAERYPMTVRYGFHGAQKVLKSFPRPELVDNQPVFHQAAVVF